VKRIVFTIVAIFAILGLTAAPALAASLHFVTASGATDDDFPSDPKKQEAARPVSNSDNFTSGTNGQISGSLTLSPPTTDPPLECPCNQTLTLVTVRYTNVQVSEPAAGTESISGTFDAIVDPDFFA
jgi:hypothetical protein